MSLKYLEISTRMPATENQNETGGGLIRSPQILVERQPRNINFSTQTESTGRNNKILFTEILNFIRMLSELKKECTGKKEMDCFHFILLSL